MRTSKERLPKKPCPNSGNSLRHARNWNDHSDQMIPFSKCSTSVKCGNKMTGNAPVAVYNIRLLPSPCCSLRVAWFWRLLVQLCVVDNLIKSNGTENTNSSCVILSTMLPWCRLQCSLINISNIFSYGVSLILMRIGLTLHFIRSIFEGWHFECCTRLLACVRRIAIGRFFNCASSLFGEFLGLYWSDLNVFFHSKSWRCTEVYSKKMFSILKMNKNLPLDLSLYFYCWFSTMKS